MAGAGKSRSLRSVLQAIESYMEARLGDDGAVKLREMAPLLLERTGGNPLFMTSIVNQLAQQEGRTPSAIVAIPHDVRRFIDRQIDELTESDRNLLTAASVIRREFATSAVAAAIEIDIDQVEIACARLARQGVFVVKSGSTTWPDGTRAELYSFRHDLYRELLYDRLTATRRALCHARVGRRLEAAWTGRLDAIAAELAEHFERGNEPARAIPHHQRAAAKALRRSANEEAIGHLHRALNAIAAIADEDERIKVEIELRIGLGAAFMATQGIRRVGGVGRLFQGRSALRTIGRARGYFPGAVGSMAVPVGKKRSGRRLAALRKVVGVGGKVRRCGAQAASPPRLLGDLVWARQTGGSPRPRRNRTCPL